MKKTVLILIIIIITFAKNTKAQTGVPDTLAYLQSIVANKAQYIGQPFSVLQNNLQIQIKYFQPFAAIHYDKDKETSTSFAFYFPNNADEIYLTFPKLKIYWQPYLNITQSLGIAHGNRGVWSSTAQAFYANGIIKDIQIRE
jgi:hypothetical protein